MAEFHANLFLDVFLKVETSLKNQIVLKTSHNYIAFEPTAFELNSNY